MLVTEFQRSLYCPDLRSGALTAGGGAGVLPEAGPQDMSCAQEA